MHHVYDSIEVYIAVTATTKLDVVGNNFQSVAITRFFDPFTLFYNIFTLALPEN